ncbi:MAG: CHASE2 domain-containing protein, partial [Acidobacteria bacterium]|nr:CHASE2 domain-containing protein [Acidobacteriota bacterium]
MKKLLALLTKKESVAAFIFLIFSFAAVGALSLYTPYLNALEGRSYDFMMSVLRGPRQTPQDLVIIGIDDASLQQFADNFGWQFPWPRAVYGELIRL